MKKLLLALLVFSLLGTTTNASIINNINIIDNQTIQFIASDDVIFSDIQVDGEVKILKDRKVSFSVKDLENSKKIMLNLSSDLNPNTSYSMISILGADGNIDFDIGDYILGEIINESLVQGESGIEKINIVDSRTIEIYFTNELIDSEFEFKILSELNVLSLTSQGNNILNIELNDILNKSSDYIAMVIFLKDAMGENIIFDEDLYDFLTNDDLIEKVKDDEEIATEVPEVVTVEEGNVEEIALNSAVTPQTGSATGILILFMVILNIIYFGRKKLFKGYI